MNCISYFQWMKLYHVEHTFINGLLFCEWCKMLDQQINIAAAGVKFHISASFINLLYFPAVLFSDK